MTDNTRVVNKYKENWDVYIGRGSIWGNPYIIGKDGTRNEVIDKYEEYLKLQIEKGQITNKDLMLLRGKRLGCFCKPKSCHGDVIVKFVKKVKT